MTSICSSPIEFLYCLVNSHRIVTRRLILNYGLSIFILRIYLIWRCRYCHCIYLRYNSDFRLRYASIRLSKSELMCFAAFLTFLNGHVDFFGKFVLLCH